MLFSWALSYLLPLILILRFDNGCSNLVNEKREESLVRGNLKENIIYNRRYLRDVEGEHHPALIRHGNKKVGKNRQRGHHRRHNNTEHQHKHARNLPTEFNVEQELEEVWKRVNSTQKEGDMVLPWETIQMPEKSWFAGFGAPSDPKRWRLAQGRAILGEQVLLRKLLEKIKNPLEFHSSENHFKWPHVVSDMHIGKGHATLSSIGDYDNAKRPAPIVHLGYRKFEHVIRHGATRVHEGHEKGWSPFGPSEMIDAYAANRNTGKSLIPKKIVAIGSFDENWGWLSTHFLNRTVCWGHRFKNDVYTSDIYPQGEIQMFLDDPNLIMLLVNQHNNITHEKVIAMPLGIPDPISTWETIHSALKTNVMKHNLLFSAGSNYGTRPYIRQCVQKNMGKGFKVSEKVSVEEFKLSLVSSKVILCMPGLGYDTYRLWESIASGAMPVMERGFGLDRTLYRLPVLLLDDFYDITPTILMQAYIEALYIAESDGWEFERMTRHWWVRLLFDASMTGNSELLQRLHPMSAVDEGFTRPLFPYDCEKMGGCGPGTKRVPKNSCSIKAFKNMNEARKYNWDWTK